MRVTCFWASFMALATDPVTFFRLPTHTHTHPTALPTTTQEQGPYQSFNGAAAAWRAHEDSAAAAAAAGRRASMA